MFSLNILRSGSVKTQLILLSIINVVTCFDSESTSGQFLEPHLSYIK